MADKKIIIGILGGMCSGKSSAAEAFARLGCGVIDADKIAHEMLENERIKSQIREFFGKGVFTEDGRIDRASLGEAAFDTAENVERINAIIHPPVLAKIEDLVDKMKQKENVRAIVLDMPLLAEAGWADKCDKLVFVDCKDEIRGQRAGQNGVFSKNQLKKREKFQISLDKKTKIADYTIYNNSGLSAMAEQVERIFSIIINSGQV